MGTVEGNNHKLSNIYNKNTEEENQGLFGVIENTTIKNVKVISGDIKADKYTGAIVGKSINSDIINCNNEANIFTQYGLGGGIAGFSTTGKVERCNNNGQVSGYGNGIGGIVGILQNSNIYYCNNNNNVTQNEGIGTGGIVGIIQVGGTVENCNNIGKIYITKGDGNDNCLAGGIAGKAEKAKINLCVNKVEIESAGAYVGGLVGEGNSEVTNSHNEGIVKVLVPNIQKNVCVGGIAGQITTEQNSNARIENCYNTNTITGSGDHVAGIVAFTSGDIINCYNTADICSTSGIIGGIAGDNAPNTSGENIPLIYNCYNTGKVEAKGIAISVLRSEESSYIGGICGGNHGTINKCWNSGEIKGVLCVGGISSISQRNILESYNIGKVQATEKDTYNNSVLGGICAYIYEEAKIEYCYNRGDIVTEYGCVGGIVGIQWDESAITNSYNTFQVSNGANRSCLVGHAKSGTTQNQCYYLGTTTSGTQRTEADMKTNEFINLLGGTTKWKIDTNNKNNGFAILSWQ